MVNSLLNMQLKVLFPTFIQGSYEKASQADTPYRTWDYHSFPAL
jgi:hypothetical protein